MIVTAAEATRDDDEKGCRRKNLDTIQIGTLSTCSRVEMIRCLDCDDIIYCAKGASKEEGNTKQPQQ